MTECTHTKGLSNKEYLEEFYRNASQRRIPLSGSLDLTYRCNLRCVHCYVGTQDDVHEMQKEEMKTDRLLSLIDEITDAGCLDLLMSGGEPLIRRDFSELYVHAKMRGLLVTVFTNGTLLTDDVLALFHRYPPYLVEISLYGATAATYEGVTGVAGSYARCIEGIERLLSKGIRVRLKTMLMTLNSHELSAMEEMARGYGISFRLDAALFPRLNGDRAPLLFRVSPEDAVEKELADVGRLASWNEYYCRGEGAPGSDQLYVCGAGNTGFHVDPYGILKPCVMVRSITFDLAGGSFQSGWDGAIKEIGSKKANPTYACMGCERYMLCSVCPAFFELENGAEDIHSEYLCAISREREKRIALYAHSER